nr:hypothetical protein [Tanacetum cinerariifolium]
MTTCNAGQRTAATRGGRTSEQDGREGDRSGDQVENGRGSQGSSQGSQGSGRGGQVSGRGNQGGGRSSQESDQGSQESSRGNGANGGGGGVPDFANIIAQQLAGYVVYTDRFYKLSRLVSHLVALENKRIERNGSLKKNTVKRGNGEESSRDGNAKDDNKRSKTRRAFVTVTNPDRKEYTGKAPKCPNCNYHHRPDVPCRWCTNCNRFGNIAKDCRVGPKVVNPLNARNSTAARGACFECGGTDHYKAACPRLNRALRRGGNHPNQVMAIEGGQNHRNNENQARGRAFVMGLEEAR